jgi:TP53 regulating kinase-like protein
MSQEILNQGAEAIIEKRGNEIIKKRIEKSYRIKEIDDRIRKLRTRSEAKILEKASKIIPVPRVIKIDENTKEIFMENIDGIRLSDSLDSFPLQKQKEICEEIGYNISKLHNENIIHGDLTPSNMIYNDNMKNLDGKRDDIKVFFIDFGLGFISAKIEDRAVDLHLLREALEANFSKNMEVLFDSVKKGYSKDYKDAKLVLERFKAVERRGRYKQGS